MHMRSPIQEAATTTRLLLCIRMGVEGKQAGVGTSQRALVEYVHLAQRSDKVAMKTSHFNFLAGSKAPRPPGAFANSQGHS